MSKKDEKTSLNELRRSLEGCYGSHSIYSEVKDFLRDCFRENDENEKKSEPRWSICIWGWPGTGKTDCCKEFKSEPVMWRGKKYDGYHISDVPVAQFEEMGDLHGLPSRCSFVIPNPDSPDKMEEPRWVPEEHIASYQARGWSIDGAKGVQTQMAPPDWVPREPGPSILILDDWNRASVRIIKGIMQLLQNYGMVSWKLPPGCNIVLTGNPDGAEQDFLVTSIDTAILTRIKHITLKEDVKEWAIWAEAQKLDSRGIGYVLYKPEDFIGKERTNPRTLSEFFRFLRNVSNIQAEQNRVMLHANSLLDEETVASFMVYVTRTVEMVLEPDEILNGDPKVFPHITKLMGQKEPRLDVLSVIIERLFSNMVQPDCKIDDKRIAHFQEFITNDIIPNDLRHSFCRRLAKRQNGECVKWLLGHKKLKGLIMESLKKF